MRRLLITVLILFSVSFVFASSDEEMPRDYKVTYDLFARATTYYDGSTLAPGGGLSLGLQTGKFKFEGYALCDYFLAPMGSKGGAMSLEFMVESGVRFAWSIISFWVVDVFIGVDTGYYMQFATVPQDPDNIHLFYNGLMIRPEVYIQFNIAKHYDMQLGLYYQSPIFPYYKSYSGLGVMFAIL